MIKNKDGSYNNFKILIISLIFIIIISITGFYILQNIELPKIETPSWTTPTPTVIPTPTSTPIPIDPRIAELYNSTNITYSNSTSWNWTYTNFSNSSNWTYPQEMIGNYTFIAGSGGGGGSGSSANISYTVIAGGGGGAGYTSATYINSTPVTPVNQTTSQTTSNLSQNVSPIFTQMMNPFIESPWMYLLIVIPMVMMMSMIRGNSLSMIIPAILIIIVICYLFNITVWSILPMILMIPMLLIILSMFADR
jgi:hypothetical protein